MILNFGTQEKILGETTTGAASFTKEGSTKSDSILVSLWVGSIASGDLTVTVSSLTGDGKEVGIISFPVLSATTSSLLLRKSASTLQRFKVSAVTTGACTFEVYVRAVSGAEASSRILGQSTLKTTKTLVGTSPATLLAASLSDRSGVILKNNSTAAIVTIAESSAQTSAAGWPLSPGEAVAIDIAAGVSLWAVSDTASTDVRIMEAGA